MPLLWERWDINAFLLIGGKGLLDASAIRGGWEQFVVKTIDVRSKG